VAAISVAVVRGRDTLVMKGYGFADVENEVPATAQTVYRIGSVTKQFTSVATMQLIEQGKLSLDDDVTKYVPSAPVHGRKVPIRYLLNHTSGIPSYTDVGPTFGRVMRMDLPHDSLLATVRNDSLQFEPGTHFYYNNTGYFLLGMVIEKVTGKKYGDYLHDVLFAPNGLTSTMYCRTSELIKHRASGYDATPRGLTNADYISMDLPYAAGSLCSTVGDLVAWTGMLHTPGKLVSHASFASMTTPVKLPSGRNMTYGFGLMADTLASHRRIHHGGGINGFISEVAYYPDDSLTVVVLSNTAPAPSNQIADALARVAFGLPANPPQQRPDDLAIPADELARIAGNYLITFPDGSKRRARMYAEGPQLMLQVENQPGVRLLKQSSPNTFVAMGQGRIIVDVSGGKVTGFVIDRGARPLEAVRAP
jgi:CubicO group peptidase (beta-lactamase class C family)